MSNRLPFQDFHREIAESTQSLLEKGVDVKFHTNGGKIHDCTLFYDPDQRRLEVKKTTGFFKFVFQTRGINLSDIYSLRPGTHSFGFVQAKSENEKQENVSILKFCKSFTMTFVDSVCRSLVRNVPLMWSCHLSEQGMFLCTNLKYWPTLCIIPIKMPFSTS